MGLTKRPKRVVVEDIEMIDTYPRWTCPSCHQTFFGGAPCKTVTRFRCTCGQELIVASRTTRKLEDYDGQG